MTGDILALDVGTSALKLGVFGPDLEPRCQAERAYAPHVYDGGKADIDPETWWAAIRDACAEVRPHLRDVAVVALSVTTPALTPMAEDGTALAPAILFFDGRSRAQAAAIRRRIGEERFLEEACNLPVSGGSSLASILWIRDERPEVWRATAVFGHCNTFVVRRLTGRWAIDPSTVSITGLYATARDDLAWNADVLAAAGIPEAMLPPLYRSHDAVGPILPAVADELGLPRECVVLCGGNDAVLAALSGGRTDPGAVTLVSGTCDIASVCTDAPVASRDFNVRCHVVPGRWLTFFVLNTGGAALDWFHATCCRELTRAEFHQAYVPAVLDSFLAGPGVDAREARLPAYEPFLGGSRYSLEPLTAAFAGLTVETTREDLLLALIRGNARYLGAHLEQVRRLVPLNPEVAVTGGGSRMPAMLAARRRWTGPFDYVFHDQSSLLGAAMLGRIHQSGRMPVLEQVARGTG